MESAHFDTPLPEGEEQKIESEADKRKRLLNANPSWFKAESVPVPEKRDHIPHMPFVIENAKAEARPAEQIESQPKPEVSQVESAGEKSENKGSTNERTIEDTFAKMIHDAGFDFDNEKPAEDRPVQFTSYNQPKSQVEHPFSRPAAEVEPEEEEDDPINPKQKRHIEQSAWHTIVEDENNREDISARSRYGKEFEHEQREVRTQLSSSQQYVSRNKARKNALLAFAAGLLIGRGADEQRIKRELQDTYAKLEKIGDKDKTLDGLANNPQVITPDVPTSLPPLNVSAHSAPIAHDNQMTLPDGITMPELPSGISSDDGSQHLLISAGKRSTSVLLNPWVWTLVGLLILIFFGASFIG